MARPDNSTDAGHRRPVKVVETQSYSVGHDVPHVAAVDQGATFVLHTRDASGDQMRENVELASIDEQRLFPVAGPVRVNGVRPGDLLQMSVGTVDLCDVAHTWTRPGLGFGSDIPFHVQQVDLTSPRWPGQEHIDLPLRPHVGALGVLSGEAIVPARDLGAHGGNVDFGKIGAGAELWLTANVDGGGVFAGDLHAGIGDGEVCGTGLETAGAVTLEVRSHGRPRTPEPLPIVRNGRRAWLIGIGDCFEQALEQAVRTAMEKVAVHLSMSPDDAYLLVSQLLRVTLCQLVNPHTSVAVTLQEGLDAAFLSQLPLDEPRIAEAQ